MTDSKNYKSNKILFLKNKICDMESFMYELPLSFKETRNNVKKDILSTVEKLKTIGYDYYK